MLAFLKHSDRLTTCPQSAQCSVGCLLAGAVGDGLHEHAVLLAVVPVQNVAHGLGHAALAVDVELCERVVHGVGEAHDPRHLVLAPAPVEGGQVDAGEPVDGLGQHEDGSYPDDGDGGETADI